MDERTIYMLIGAFISGAVFWIIVSASWKRRHQSYAWIFAIRNHKKMGIPCKTDKILKRKGYCLGYSYKRKAALWVSYIASAGSVCIDVPRSGRFYPDPDIPKDYRLIPDNFRNTGYDKGHLAPSAVIDFSQKANEQTFAMSNVVLQHPRLNRQAWGSLENLIRKWTGSIGKIYTVTGPIYSLRPRRVNNIQIPSRFYQVIYSFKYKKAIGFVFPNTEIPAARLWQYAMSVRDVEKDSGLDFLSKISKRKRKKIKNKCDIDWWKSR